MAFRDTSSFGKRMEFHIINQMLVDKYDVYTPLVDDHGVDCIIKKDDGTFLEIQIKARSKEAKQPGCFTVDNHLNEIENFYFVFYSELVNTTWVFSSSDFVKYSSLNQNGKCQGRRKINLLTRNKKISKKYEKFIKEEFYF